MADNHFASELPHAESALRGLVPQPIDVDPVIRQAGPQTQKD